MATTADSSPICASPSVFTISSADRPDSYILAKTSLAMALLIVPWSTSLIRPASDSGGITSKASFVAPGSLYLRSVSPITQLLAAFGFPEAAATASK